MSGVSRREFLQASTGVALGAGLWLGRGALAQDAAAAPVPPSEKIVLGFVGLGGRGAGHIGWFGRHPDVEIGAICDVYDAHCSNALERAADISEGKAKPKVYKDFRKLLEQQDLDAIVCATPPHWHPLVTIYACQAGKDVYCEKPMALTQRESRAMVKAARANQRITQIGTQIHADENYHRVVEIVRSGILGKISVVRNQLMLNEAPDGIGKGPDTDPPEGLDWDMWLGPLQPMPFNMAKFKAGQHRYFAELVGSWLHEMGPHIVDLPFWALEPGAPLSVTAMGGKFATDDISTIPDTMEVVYEFPNYLMTWSNACANSFGFAYQHPPFQEEGKTGIGRRLGVAFQGDKGTLLANYGAYHLVSEGDRMVNPTLPEPSLPRSPGHEREFLDCIKSRELPSCDVEKHYPLAVALNLGNLSYKVGRKIRWDAEKEEIIGDAEANALLTPNYRSPWTLPV